MEIIKGVVDHWKNDWKERRAIFWFELIGTTGSITASALVSIYAAMPPMLLCFSIWLIGSTFLMIGSYLRRSPWVFVLMVFNTIINIVGITTLTLLSP